MMDKEQLLEFFRKNYLSRREVLFRLPLNISIESFWQELQNRRKSQATILPLLNAAGKPYWYTVTDDMVKASEKLCETALAQDGSFDPYRTQMTGAIMQECFFTSFVEGAQIPVQEAMDYLQEGSEPENIQEQMLWNNHNAWLSIMNSLYRPIDDNMLKSLAFMLTEDMEGCSEEYRQTDQHSIAAMNSEAYSLPSAFVLSDRMNEFCAFLQKPDIHPLIKAAVGQAYILVTRPFTEGNERLSRMISYIVLIRSGYEFFRDISISGMIARESYRYFKSMCEILRDENDGDLTYFLDYFLGMLARALDVKKESDARAEQENLEKERSMGREPLRPPEQKHEPVSEPVSEPVIEQQVFAEEPEDDEPEEEPVADTRSFAKQINIMEYHPNFAYRNTVPMIRELINKGIEQFTIKEWTQYFNCSKTAGQNAVKRMLDCNVIENISSNREGVFRFTLSKAVARDIPRKEPRETITISKEMAELLATMEKSNNSRDIRIGRTLRKLISEGKLEFRAQDWVDANPDSQSVRSEDLRKIVNMGIVEKYPTNHPNVLRYVINPRPQTGLKTKNITDTHKELLTALYNRFQQRRFTYDEAASYMKRTKSSIQYHVCNLVASRVIQSHVNPGQLNTYSIAVTPEDHPECFILHEEKAAPQTLSQPLPTARVQIAGVAV